MSTPYNTGRVLTTGRLREVLAYDADTGIFTRLERSAAKVRIGDIAGGIDPQGYTLIRVDLKRYRAHRLAWLYMTEVWPDGQIDHINGIRSDNTWGNLRDVTNTINCQNKHQARSDNKSGFLGVSRDKKAWRAVITINGARKYLGRHETPEIAYAAYLKAKRRYHEGCTI